ncbi:TetR/AcrR family transcriptional regulator [Flexivirga sp. ID2601S]|uniref:TetR/AcrR family transcriptional regulator n=1 Tax=Flexivirga aerilata TaxID=1656889 RepID=A0A849AJL4_9MICO|nr:TetR/AcrR family transcriptional regulator [Flexivirga aerilata]NNG40559.1 TetR/AcrR family transcriptional regulator [Flexivirga aerilata]
MESSRLDRRKAHTRAALIRSAQEFLAEGNSAATIREITDRADVGFGSFYNHFASKEDLFDAAVLATLDMFDEWRAVATVGLTEPAELFATSYRFALVLVRSQPLVARLALAVGPRILTIDRGFRQGALADLTAGVAQGRFVGDPQHLFMMVGGAFLGTAQLLLEDEDLDAESTATDLARRVLLMLGLDRREAERISAIELPPAPQA